MNLLEKAKEFTKDGAFSDLEMATLSQCMANANKLFDIRGLSSKSNPQDASIKKIALCLNAFLELVEMISKVVFGYDKNPQPYEWFYVAKEALSHEISQFESAVESGNLENLQYPSFLDDLFFACYEINLPTEQLEKEVELLNAAAIHEEKEKGLPHIVSLRYKLFMERFVRIQREENPEYSFHNLRSEWMQKIRNCDPSAFDEKELQVYFPDEEQDGVSVFKAFRSKFEFLNDKPNSLRAIFQSLVIIQDKLQNDPTVTSVDGNNQILLFWAAVNHCMDFFILNYEFSNETLLKLTDSIQKKTDELFTVAEEENAREEAELNEEEEEEEEKHRETEEEKKEREKTENVSKTIKMLETNVYSGLKSLRAMLEQDKEVTEFLLGFIYNALLPYQITYTEALEVGITTVQMILQNIKKQHKISKLKRMKRKKDLLTKEVDTEVKEDDGSNEIFDKCARILIVVLDDIIKHRGSADRLPILIQNIQDCFALIKGDKATA